MTFKKALKQILNKEKPMIDVIHYFVGNYRYFFWYGGWWSKYFNFISKIRKKVIRRHIKEQIEYRLRWMNLKCYTNGECIKCGCMTTQLQMCSKACDGLCYPSMMTKGEWEYYKVGGTFKDKHGTWTPELNNDNKPILI